MLRYIFKLCIRLVQKVYRFFIVNRNHFVLNREVFFEKGIEKFLSRWKKKEYVEARDGSFAASTLLKFYFQLYLTNLLHQPNKNQKNVGVI